MGLSSYSVQDLLRAAALQRDLHLVHLATIPQRQELARHGLAIDRHVKWRVPLRWSVIAHANGVGRLAVAIGDFVAGPAGSP